jgi:hypothetical protein
VPFLGERWIELALDPALAIPGRLAVADEQEARRRRPGLNPDGLVGLRREGIWKLNGDAGLGRVRARSFDLDIYTNFLLIRSGWADLRRRTRAVTRLAGRDAS